MHNKQNSLKVTVSLRRSRMADDREILREIWEGRIPVCFQLAEEEVENVIEPDPFYIMVPRLLYFPLVTDKVRRHFVPYVKEEKSTEEIWLEHEEQPINWNYPIGLLFDLNVLNCTLPWPITVHFGNYPESQILRCSSKDVVKSHFMSSIKEADALKHKGQVINNMEKKDHQQLWTGFSQDKFDQFWTVNRKLMESNAGEGFKHIPIRIYESGSPLLQKLIKPLDESNSWITLLDTVLRFKPNIDITKVRIVTHGIQPPLETPLQWLSEHFSYPDNFLHIAILDASIFRDR